jgi:Transposase IS116/IS110/IS902 family
MRPSATTSPLWTLAGPNLRALVVEIEAAAGQPPLAGQVSRLRCFRGIDTLPAVTIAAEVCDFHRFGSATSFMGFTGLVPSEFERSERTSRIDHQGRQGASSPGLGRGRLERSSPSRRWGRAPPAKPGTASRGPGLRVGRSVSAVLALSPARLSTGAQRGRRRGSEGTGRVYLGADDRPDRRLGMKVWERAGARAPRKDPRGRYATSDPRS